MVTCQSSELGWEVTVEFPADFLSLGSGFVNYHQSGVHQNLYTYTESHLLIYVHFFFLIQNIRYRGRSAVITYL